jgi:hypothetical protein
MSCVEEVGGPPAKAGFTEGPTGVTCVRSSRKFKAKPRHRMQRHVVPAAPLSLSEIQDTTKRLTPHEKVNIIFNKDSFIYPKLR